MQALFIHGMCCTGAVWDRWRPIFADAGFAVHAPSLPYHNPPNPAAVAGLSQASYVDFVADFVSRLPEPLVLVGHSNGGVIAQKLTAMGLSRATLLLNSLPPSGQWTVYPRMLPHALPHFAQWAFWRKPVTLSRWQADHLVFNRSSIEEANRGFAGFVPESGWLVTELVFSPMARSLSVAVSPEEIRVPMRSLAGSEDNLVSPAVGRRLRSFYGRRLEHVEVAGAGHWMPWETGWEQRAADAAAWLKHAARASFSSTAQ